MRCCRSIIGVVMTAMGWYRLGGFQRQSFPTCYPRSAIAVVLLAVLLPVFGEWSVALAQIRTDPQSEIRKSEVGVLVERLRRLERNLTLLQKQVYGGAQPVDPDAGLQAPSESSQGASRSAAWLEKRFTNLEEQLRKLTNMIEEVGYQARQNQDRLQVVSDDTALRLDALENQLRTLTGGQPTTQNPAVTDGSSLAVPSVDAAAQAEAAQDGVLGQLRVPVPQNADQNNALSDQGNNGKTANTADKPNTGENTGEEVALLPAALPKEQYDFAVELLWGSDYAKAEKALREFIDANPDDALVGNAHYWLGETYYARKNYTQAAVIFAEGYKKYQDGKKAPDFLLKLALSLSQIGEAQQACRALSELESVFPDAPTAIGNRAARERNVLECPAS